MTKAKLLSLCLAAVLLCGCIVGFMVTGASAAEATWTVGPDGDYASVTEALQAAKAYEASTGWGSDETLTITLLEDAGGQSFDLSADGIAWSVPTIWRGNRDAGNGEIEYGNKLPITISGPYVAGASSRGGADFLGSEIAGKNVAFTNDYTFENIYVADGAGNSGKLFAGSGNVVYGEDVGGIFAGSLTDTKKVYFYADNYTDAAYIGWTAGDVAAVKAANGGVIPSSFTVGGTNFIRYTFLSGVVGYSPADEVNAQNYQTVGYQAITEEGKALESGVSVKPWDCSAEYILDGGTIGSNFALRSGSSPVKQSIMTLRSGTFNMLRNMSTAGTERWGDMIIRLEGGTATASCYAFHGASTLHGDLIVYDSGLVEWGDYGYKNGRTSGWNVDGGVGYIVTAGDHATVEYSGLLTNIKDDNDVKKLIKGVAGTANVTTYYGGYASDADYSDIILENRIEGGTIENFYGGGNKNTVGTVINTVTGGTITTNYMGGVYGTSGGATNITNNMLGGSIGNNFYGGSNKTGVPGTITNIFDGVTVTKHTYCGLGVSSSSTVGATVNHFKSGELGANVFGGSNNSAVTSITNYIYGNCFSATSDSDFFAGGRLGHCTDVTTHVFALELNRAFFESHSAASYDTNTLNLYLNSTSAGTDANGVELKNLGKIDLSAKSVSSFTAVNFFGGDEANKLVLGSTTSLVCDAVSSVTGTLYVEQAGNWANATEYVKIPKTADIVVTTAETNDYGAYEIVEKEDYKILRAKTIAPVGVQLIFSDRISTLFLFDKAEVLALDPDGAYVKPDFYIGERALDYADGELYGDNYYAVVVSGVAPADFADTITVKNRYFSYEVTLNTILDNSVTAWSADEGLENKEAWVNFAKALRNYGDAIRTEALTYQDVPAAAVVEGDAYLIQWGADTTFTPTKIHLLQNDTFGVKLEGTTTEGLTVKDAAGNEIPALIEADGITVCINLAKASTPVTFTVATANGDCATVTVQLDALARDLSAQANIATDALIFMQQAVAVAAL